MINRASSFVLRGVSLALVLFVHGAGLQAQPLFRGQSLTLDYSESSGALVERLGSVARTSVRYQSLAYRYGFDASQDLLLSFGAGYQSSDFSGSFMPIPGTLNEVSLALGAQYRIDPRWSGLLMMSPGWRYAGSKIQSEGFTTPIILGASFASSRDLAWTFGVAYREFSEYPVLPYVGVYWKFAPKWTFSLGYPRTGLSYALNEGFKVTLSVAGEGGSYYVKEHDTWVSAAVIIPGYQPLPPNPLKDTVVDYREIRVGLGFDVKFGELSTLSIEGGIAADRKWDYHRYDVSYDGRRASYARLALKIGF